MPDPDAKSRRSAGQLQRLPCLPRPLAHEARPAGIGIAHAPGNRGVMSTFVHAGSSLLTTC
jgi:hypothetical protein